MASDRPARRGEKKETDFIGCTAFGKTAEILEKYFSKGSRILLEGSIRTGSYMNRKGETVYTTDVRVENVEFIDPKNQDQYGTQKTKEQQDPPAAMQGNKYSQTQNTYGTHSAPQRQQDGYDPQQAYYNSLAHQAYY